MEYKYSKIKLAFFVGLLLFCLINSTNSQSSSSSPLMTSQNQMTTPPGLPSYVPTNITISTSYFNAVLMYLNSTAACTALVPYVLNSTFVNASLPTSGQGSGPGVTNPPPPTETSMSTAPTDTTPLGTAPTDTTPLGTTPSAIINPGVASGSSVSSGPIGYYVFNTSSLTLALWTTLNSCITAMNGSSAGPAGPTPGAPQPPPAPPTAPVNAFANVDPRIAFGIAFLNPTLSNTQVATIASSRSSWSPIFDALTSSQIASACNVINGFYNYFEDQIVLFNDNNTFVTWSRLNRVLVCKPDCNFKRLLSVYSNFSANTTGFYLNVVQFLPSKAAAQCMNQFPALQSTVSNISPQQLVNNIAQISFLKPSQLSSMSPENSLLVAQALATSNSTLSPSMAKSLGQNIPAGTPLTNIASIASAVPLSCFNSTPPGTLVNLVSSMDLGNMDSFKKGFIASKIAASNNASVITALLTSSTDSSIINAIPSSQFAALGINPMSIPAANLPKSYLKSYAQTTLATTSLSSITNSSLLARILPGINPSTISSISSSLVPATLTNIVSASISSGVTMTGAQRSAMLSSLLNSLMTSAGSTNVSVYLSYLNSTQLSVLYPLFIEANSTILAGFSTISTFSTVISSVSDLITSQCCAYSRTGRALFASYAAPYLFGYYNLALSDLYSLGPCLVSVLPDIYVQNLSPTTFINYFSTLGNIYQPSASQVTIAQSLVAAYAANTTVMASSSQDTLAFSTLSDLAIFYPFSTYASSMTTWSTNGGTLLSTMHTARSSSVAANQLCQVGLSSASTTAYTNLLNSYGSTFVTQYVSAVSSVTTTAASGRKKRQSSSYTFTCTDLTTMGSGITSLTTTQLATISTTEFYSCQSTIGSTTGWSSSQLSTLAATAKSLYGSASAISDTNMTALNNVMLGFSSSDLSTLTFTTTTSIAAFGSLSGWSSAQLSALTTPLSNYITTYLSGSITADFMTSAGNLLCSFTSTQVSSVSSIFVSSISSLSKISLACPNIANWYSLAKTVSSYGSTLYSSSSSISELGSVISGITTTDIALVSTDSISSISNAAFQYMPAATINSMSSTQLSSLSIDQVSSLLNSPYYSQFSSAVTNALSTATGGTVTVTASSGARQISLSSFAKFSMGFYFILLSIFYTR